MLVVHAAKATAWPRLALLGLASACSSVQIPDDPLAALAIASGHLERREAGEAAALLEAIDPESYTGSDLERYKVLLATALAGRGDLWDGFELIRDFEEDHPFSELRGDIQDLEFEIGRALIQSSWTFGIFASDADDGQIVLQHFALRYPRHPSTPDALRLLGEKAFRERDYALARERFSDIVLKHKDSEWLPLARFRVAMSSFNSLVGPEYDRPSLLRAHNELSALLDNKLENPAFLAEAQQSLATVRRWLAAKEVGIADFYRTIGNPLGERHHLQQAVKGYPDTEPGKQAALRLKTLPEAARTRP